MGNVISNSYRQLVDPGDISTWKSYCIVHLFLFLDPIQACLCLRVSKKWKSSIIRSNLWRYYGIIYFSPTRGIITRVEKKYFVVERYLSWLRSPMLKWRSRNSDQIPKDVTQFGRRWTESIYKIRLGIITIINDVDETLQSAELPTNLEVIESVRNRLYYMLELLDQHNFREIHNQTKETRNLILTIADKSL